MRKIGFTQYEGRSYSLLVSLLFATDGTLFFKAVDLIWFSLVESSVTLISATAKV